MQQFWITMDSAIALQFSLNKHLMKTHMEATTMHFRLTISLLALHRSTFSPSFIVTQISNNPASKFQRITLQSITHQFDWFQHQVNINNIIPPFTLFPFRFQLIMITRLTQCRLTTLRQAAHHHQLQPQTISKIHHGSTRASRKVKVSTRKLMKLETAKAQFFHLMIWSCKRATSALNFLSISHSEHRIH